MSDYMFMLDSHLNSGQSKVLAEVREVAEQSNLNLFLTGGAMRDMMGGFPIRDLDFTVEGSSIKFARAVAQRSGAQVLAIDETRKSVELLFPNDIQASIGMAHTEKYAKAGAKPQVQPATIHDDLRCRDFTVDSIALSIGNASRGLLLDPTNGLGDLARKELRAVGNYTLYDDPSRMLRLIRLKVRLGFAIDERTLNQFRNAREAQLDGKIQPATWAHELLQIASDPLAGDILKALEEENFVRFVSPALAGPKLNLAGFQRLQKARQSLPFGTDLGANYASLFLFLLLEKLSPKERAAVTRSIPFPKEQLDAAAKLEGRASKLEKELATAKITRPSVSYGLLSKIPGEVLLFLLARSGQRLVIDRIKNYLQKYLPMAQEVTDADVIEKGGTPGTPKFDKLRAQLIAARLDAKPKKVVVEEPAPPPPPPGRRSISIAR